MALAIPVGWLLSSFFLPFDGIIHSLRISFFLLYGWMDCELYRIEQRIFTLSVGCGEYAKPNDIVGKKSRIDVCFFFAFFLVKQGCQA